MIVPTFATMVRTNQFTGFTRIDFVINNPDGSTEDVAKVVLPANVALETAKMLLKQFGIDVPEQTKQ